MQGEELTRPGAADGIRVRFHPPQVRSRNRRCQPFRWEGRIAHSAVCCLLSSSSLSASAVSSFNFNSALLNGSSTLTPTRMVSGLQWGRLAGLLWGPGSCLGGWRQSTELG